LANVARFALRFRLCHKCDWLASDYGIDEQVWARAHRFSAERFEGSTDIVQEISELWLEGFNEFCF
jgi:hypothetical protein